MTKVIVIDDDLDTVDVFCEYLEIKSFEVIGKGYNGKEAVELYQKLKPQVVFLDVMMPGYDGFFALEQIKRINPQAIVIMVTADLTIETEQRLVELNASAIVYKPFDIDKIIKTLDRLAPNEGLLC